MGMSFGTRTSEKSDSPIKSSISLNIPSLVHIRINNCPPAKRIDTVLLLWRENLQMFYYSKEKGKKLGRGEKELLPTPGIEPGPSG